MPDGVQTPTTSIAPDTQASDEENLSQETLFADETADPYDESGNPRWENAETGEPVDQFGNVIAGTRPAPIAAAPVAEDTPTEPAPAPAPLQFRSPFADGLLTDQEREAAEDLVTPQAMALIETVAQRIAARTIAADRQQAMAARQLGLPDEYGHRMAQMQQFVPANLQGTKEGAIMAAALAAAQEGIEAGDIQSVFRKLGGVQQMPVQPPSPAPAPVRQPLPPSSVTHTPVGSPDAARVTQRYRPEKTIAGLTAEELAIINRERAARNGGSW